MTGITEDTAPAHIPLSGPWSLWPVGAVRSAGLPVGWLEAFAEVPADTGGKPCPAARRLAAEDGFVEAVTWQNPAVIDNWLGRYHEALMAADGAGRAAVPLARRGQREVLLATLAQRYCAKNETIGFFGPVAWCTFRPEAAGLSFEGSATLRRRRTFVEGWVAAAVAAAINEDPALVDVLPLRRHPLCGLVDGVVQPPRGRRSPTTPERLAVLGALGAPRSLTDLRAALGGTDVDGVVRELIADGLVLRGFAVPLLDEPDVWLLSEVRRLPPGSARDRWVTGLEELGRAVEGVGAAAGRPQHLRAALARCAAVTRALLGQDDLDRSGAAHGRGLVYEDCRRDLDVVVGGEVLDALRTPLDLLLRSARWLVAEVGREVEQELRRRLPRLTDADGRVSVARLLLGTADVLSGADGTAVHHVVEDFQSRWAEILSSAGAADGGAIRLRSSTVGPLVDALFPDPGVVPWQAARQHSPDLMLRTRSDGRRPQWVLGELHLALNTLENRPFLTGADDPATLRALTRRDFAAGRLVPIWPRSSREVTSRTYPPLAMDLPDLYTYWSYALDEGRPDGTVPLTATTMDVRDAEGTLVARIPGHDRELPVRELFGEFLTALVVDRFHLRPAQEHLPRLLLDDVVVERESWTLDVSSLPLADPAGTDAVGLTRAMRELGCPRHTFVKLAGQRKPMYVDLEAPLLVRGLAQALRREAKSGRATTVRLVEMLPGPSELWLRHGDDSWTSEFRVVVTEEGAPRRDLLLR